MFGSAVDWSQPPPPGDSSSPPHQQASVAPTANAWASVYQGYQGWNAAYSASMVQPPPPGMYWQADVGGQYGLNPPPPPPPPNEQPPPPPC